MKRRSKRRSKIQELAAGLAFYAYSAAVAAATVCKAQEDLEDGKTGKAARSLEKLEQNLAKLARDTRNQALAEMGDVDMIVDIALSSYAKLGLGDVETRAHVGELLRSFLTGEKSP